MVNRDEKRISENITKMLLRRGYTTTGNSFIYQPLKKVYGPYTKPDPEEHILVIFFRAFFDTGKGILSKSDARKVMADILQEAEIVFSTLGTCEIILIVPEIVREKYAKDLPQGLAITSTLIEEYLCMYDPNDSILVPIHTPATPQELEDLARLKIEKKHLPILPRDDIISRWNGYKPDTILKIVRTYEGDEEVYYRVVV